MSDWYADDRVVGLQVLMPLAFLALTGIAISRHRLQWALGLVGLVGTLSMSVLATAQTGEVGTLTTQAGGWSFPLGITLRSDPISAMVLSVALAILLVVYIYSFGSDYKGSDNEAYAVPLYFGLAAGVTVALLTADLFTLFVGLELMLASSYVLLLLGGRADQLRAGMSYVVISLVASGLLVLTIALVYASTGALNFDEIALRMDGVSPALRDTLSLLLLLSLGIKAAMFPLFFWLPDAYPTANAPVTALFAGVVTKLSVVVIAKTQIIIFGRSSTWWPLAILAILTMVVGVLGAIAQDDIKRILSFHIVSQIGYMLFGVALFSVSGVAAAMFFVIHQIPTKTALFMIEGQIESTTGTGKIHILGGLMQRMPVVAGLFVISAVSLAGIPPTSGFFGKILLFDAGLGSDQNAGIWFLVFGLIVSFGTVFSMTKIWNNVFWGSPDGDYPRADAQATTRLRPPRLSSITTGAVVASVLLIAVFAGPLLEWCQEGAEIWYGTAGESALEAGKS